MLAHGLIDTVNDIDVLARGGAWQKALSLKDFEQATGGDKIIHIPNQIDIFNGWLNLDKEAILARATLIDSLPYADLRDVLAFKQKLNRVKDQAHLSKLRAYLAP